MLVLAVIPVAGCTPEYYQRSADREVARIVEQRKVETLKYRPQSEAKTSTPAEPSARAYEEVPLTSISHELTKPLERQEVVWPDAPLGPAVPPPEDDNFDYVPASYATFGIGMSRLGPAAPGEQDLSLSLLSSVEYAVTHARDYQDQMESLYLATLDVALQRHLFEPRPFARTQLRYDGSQGGTDRSSQEYKSALSAINSVGIRQQLPYGGELTAQQLVETVHALNQAAGDGDTAQTALTASIPLLKGAGLVNLEDLIDSERQLIYSVRGFESYRRSFAVNVASQFIRLVLAQQGIANRRQNYENLKLLTERAVALYQSSTASGSRVQFLDVQRARQNLLNAESSLIDAVTAYQGQLDSFKIFIGMPVSVDLDIAPVQLAVNIPDLDNVDASQLAIKYRLDLQTSRDRIDDARRAVANARNGLQPDLRIFASGTVGNMSDERWSNYDSDTWGYATGVTVDWPVDVVNERNIYRRSMILLERAQRSYVQTREQISSDVRQTVRSIRVALVSLEIQKRGVELNQKRLDLANERLIQGKAQVLDVVDAQSALLNAQDAYDRARSNVQTLVLQYLRDTGTLRIDPAAGALGRAMDRAAVMQRKGPMYNEIEQQIQEKP